MTISHHKNQPNYGIHDDLYREAKDAGWDGWGGNERLANAEHIARFFDIDTPIPKGKLLELGCGEGHICRAFAQHGYKVTGLISPLLRLTGQKKKPSPEALRDAFLWRI